MGSVGLETIPSLPAGVILCPNTNVSTGTNTSVLETTGFALMVMADNSVLFVEVEGNTNCYDQLKSGGSSMLWIILGIIGGILLLIVIAGVIVMVLKGKKGSDEDTEGMNAKLTNW